MGSEMCIRDRFQNPDNQLVTTVVEEDVAFGPENLGVPSAEIRTRVDEALAAVGMERFAARAPHMLSGGQKQRIAIARALILDPEILILDDAVSAVDTDTEEQILRNLAALRADKTNIIIAHRISTLQHADQIIVLDEGRIVGKGTHEELLKTCEVYQQIAMSQLSKEELGK